MIERIAYCLGDCERWRGCIGYEGLSSVPPSIWPLVRVGSLAAERLLREVHKLCGDNRTLAACKRVVAPIVVPYPETCRIESTKTYP
jgi:hypothetical protein